MKLSVIILSVAAVFMTAPLNVLAQQSVDSRIMPEMQTGRTDLSKNDQWHNLRRWVSLTFDRSNVIDMEDAERGTMIIKWSCPVVMPSDFVAASVSMTYVIDVRDGKYRLQRLNPRVSYQIIRPDAAEYYDSALSSTAAADIKLINDISRHFYDGSSEWPVNEQYDEIAAAYLNEAGSIDQYRNDRDRERGKINDDWRRAQRNWAIVSKPLTTIKQLDASMTASLAKALSTNDDF